MPIFSAESKSNLLSCHKDLQTLFIDVIKNFDCTILCGHRDEAAQILALQEGKTKVSYPNSKHNKIPSMAVDVAPYPIDWKELSRFYFFGGYVKKTAELLRIKIRWGGDWDSDTIFSDQSFYDLPHFELI